jgi:hypothetical protein
MANAVRPKSCLLGARFLLPLLTGRDARAAARRAQLSQCLAPSVVTAGDNCGGSHATFRPLVMSVCG